MKKSLLFNFFIFSWFCAAQEKKDSIRESDGVAIEKLTYKQQPGLALAASKIFFSENRYSISGFGEFNYVPLQTNLNKEVGDLELYYTGLYRAATFFGYRITDKLIWNSEFQVEFLHDGTNESHSEIVIEAFVDYLFKDYLKGRIGFYPLTIGYVNNNDEPVMFYSVNRAEVERIIIPSTWIEFGVMFYGNITPTLNYAIGFSQGLNSENYNGGTWIRQGREIRLDAPQSISVNPQINYTGINNLTLSASGYFGNSGQGGMVVNDSFEPEEVKATISLGSAYAKYNWENFSFVTVGTYGKLSDTDKIYLQTADDEGVGQVLGSEVYGYLFETGCDILPYIRKGRNSNNEHNDNWFYNPGEMKFNLFLRYERLNTHASVHGDLQFLPRNESDMKIWTTGFNFNTKENIVFKANYQYRNNNFSGDLNPSKNIIEVGVGFIF